MITKEQVKTGLERGIIRLITDPNLESGTVCAIGDTNEFWFYFGGSTAEELTPAEYLHDVPMEDIIDEIYVALCDFPSDKDSPDEYELYESLLYKSLLKEETKMEKDFDDDKFVQYLANKFRGDETYMLREMVEKVIAYGKEHKQVSKDQFCNWLTDIIPLLSFGEAAMFMEDDRLTKHGQKEKATALEYYQSDAKNSEAVPIG